MEKILHFWEMGSEKREMGRDHSRSGSESGEMRKMLMIDPSLIYVIKKM